MKHFKLIVTLSLLFHGYLISAESKNWRNIVSEQLPLLGHRNWIVVVDSAYPLQNSPGINTVFVDEDQVEVVKEVLNQVTNAAHIQATIYLDSELRHVSENKASGISKYRNNLNELLSDKVVVRELHEAIIAKLDQAGETFNILVLKTPLLLPYTSVFFQLECGYWNAESEAALRKAMKP